MSKLTRTQRAILDHILAGGGFTRFLGEGTQWAEGGTMDGRKVRQSTLDGCSFLTAPNNRAPYRLHTAWTAMSQAVAMLDISPNATLREITAEQAAALANLLASMLAR